MRSSPTDSGEAFAKSIAAEVRAEMGRQGFSTQALTEKLGWQAGRLYRRISPNGALVPFDVIELREVADALEIPLLQLLPEASLRST